ncbi:putative dead deah box helicase [Diaporthe ampelina]|uniref:ATP-dependent RNA helicase n=1 Tax=Diaporthe ampelina TaxID=1214573 RepID=A0A0G2HSY8_9PEZI|nr:putative dead deah box helicase [Diaporthe ampelina]
MYARYIPPPKASSKPKPQAPSPPPPETASPAASAIPYSRYVPPPRKQPSATATPVPTVERSIPTSRTHLNAAAIPPPEALPPKIVFNYDEDEPSPPKKRRIDSPEPVPEPTPEPQEKKPKKEKKEKKAKKEKKKYKDTQPEGGEEDVGSRSDKKEKKKKQFDEQPFSFGFNDSTTALQDDHREVPGSVEEEYVKPKDKKKKRQKGEVDDETILATATVDKTEVTDSKKKRKKREKDEIAAGHKAVLERASKELKKAAEQPKTEDLSDDEGLEAVEAHGLEPLPQPKPVKQDAIKPSYETVPSWIANPIQVAPTAISPFADLGISEDAATRLEAKGFKEAFAVQTAVIPLLLPSPDRQGDVVVSAATGSGKTLAYALPMVRDISQSSNITRIRGLIVVPTRELVMQAEEVCNACSAVFVGRGRKPVKVGISMGNKQFEQEQADLVEEYERYDPEGYQKYLERKFDEDSWLDDLTNPRGPPTEPLPYHVIDYASKVDILICTPGRLVDHIKRTPGFTLDYVRWLVVDEADKLLAQTYQDWISTVMPLLSSTERPGAREFADSNKAGVRKVVLSATMTRDLTLLNGLKLSRPRLVVLSDTVAHSEVEHVLPSQLEETAVKTRNVDLKPLYLVDLLNSEHMAPVSASDADDVEMKDAEGEDTFVAESESAASDSDSDDSSSNDEFDSDSEESDADSTASPSHGRGTSSKPPPKPFNTTVLIFANSNEAAVRLARLLSLLSPHLAPLIGTLTSTTRTSERRKTLHAFAARKLRILVASSLIERGIHLTNLDHVISYDMPKSVQSYVHRVGRTARAGRQGHSWTLFTKPEAGWFWTAIAGKGQSKAGTAQGEIRRRKGVGEIRISDRWDEDRLEEFNAALENLSELRKSSKRKGSKLQHVA